MKLNLNQRGFTHGVVLMAVVALFAIAGVGLLVASHAASGLPAPTGVKLSSTSAKAVLIDWDDNAAKSADFSYYAVRRSTTTTDTKQPGWTRMPGNLTVSQFTDTTATVGKKYNYYVVAFNKARQAGVRSKVMTITAGTTPAPNPGPIVTDPGPGPNPGPNPTPIPSGDGKVLWNGDLSTGNTSQYKSVQAYTNDTNPNRIKRVQVMKDPLGLNRNVVKLSAYNGDIHSICGNTCPTENPRAQILSPTIIKTVDNNHDPENKGDYWIGSSMMIPTDFPQFVPGDNWLSTGSIYGPPFGGTSGNGVYMDPHGNSPTTAKLYFSAKRSTTTDGPWTQYVEKGKWVDIVQHFKVSANPSIGYREIWTNVGTGWKKGVLGINKKSDKPMYDTYGPFNNKGDNFYKVSIYYRHNSLLNTDTKPASLYFASVKIGTSFNAVSPHSY